MEIIIVIVIIVVIMMVIGGLSPMTATTDMVEMKRLAESQWYCRPVVWTKAPEVKNNIFKGDLELKCAFEAIGQVGIQELHRHMLDTLPKIAGEIKGEGEPVRYQGLPGLSYNVAMKVNSKNDSAKVHGKAVVASNGVSEIRNAFTSEEVEGKGMARYLKTVNSEIKVQTLSGRPGWYTMTYTQTSEIERPFIVPASTFKKQLVKKLEGDLSEKAEAILTNISNHL